MKKFLSDYGMLPVLLVLCVLLSLLTWETQGATGAPAGRELARRIGPEFGRVVIVAGETEEDRAFADALRQALGRPVLETVHGRPPDVRRALERLGNVDAIAASRAAGAWPLFQDFPGARLFVPEPTSWPTFLKADNLVNVANQIVVTSIVAVGMTVVILAGGIDLAAGSLIALAAVVGTLLIGAGGGEQAGTGTIVLASLAAILACAVAGLVSGLMITVFGVPPFLTTLGMMLMASGTAFLLSRGQSISEVPASFVWLGRGSTFLSVPNGVVLMVLLFVAAHVFMSKTVPGRYLYAIGGNVEAARLSGVPVRRLLVFTYVLSGALAGLGGIVTASQLRSGSANYGVMAELYVIAAVVVGGTSLSGGRGRILGTLIGALIIGVIQNGMNLLGINSYLQKVVLGIVILGAAVLDGLKRQVWLREKTS